MPIIRLQELNRQGEGLLQYICMLDLHHFYPGWFLCHQKKIVIERTRDLIYLKFVAKDFSPKIISPSAGENSGDSA